MENLEQLQRRFEECKARGLALNMQRGQPADENFNLANPLLSILDKEEAISHTGLDLRNYPGGAAGLMEARELFAEILELSADEVIVGNNASLKMLSNLVMWAMITGLKGSDSPWTQGKTRIIVTAPGYDRHFTLLEALGLSMVTVPMTSEGPDMDQVEMLAAKDPAIRGIIFVPTYSNPTGDCLSEAYARRLASMKTAASDFTIIADDAYAVHHLTDQPAERPDLIKLCREAGNPDRAYIFASTSKITFSGAGIGAMASSKENIKWFLSLLTTQFIGPNKVEQYRHVKFLQQYQGGVKGLMKDHAKIIQPKFEAVWKVLERELGDSGLAEWTHPAGGYFISLNTKKPVADKVVALAAEAGVSLTPAGATFPGGKDPENRNIRLAPTRPPLVEVEQAMEIVALCIKIASLQA